MTTQGPRRASFSGGVPRPASRASPSTFGRRSPSPARSSSTSASRPSSRPRSRSGTASRRGRSSRRRDRVRRRASRSSVSAATRRRIGFREGFLVVALTWLARGGVRRDPLPPLRRAAARRPGRRLLRVDVGILDDGRDDPDQRRRASTIRCSSGASSPSGSEAWGSSSSRSPCCRASGSAGRQLLDSEMPGPEMDPLADRIRTTARRLWLLYIALTAVLASLLVLFGVVGIDHRMGLFEARLARVRDDADRRLHADLDLARRLRGRLAVGRGRLHGASRDQLRAPLPRPRPPPLAQRDARRGAQALPRRSSPSPPSRSSVELWADGLADGEAAIRHGVFQVVSMTTTTGFASADFASWTTFALMLLSALMFVGGSAGLDGQLGQGRSPPPRRPVAPARAAPDAASGGGHADPAQRPRRRRRRRCAASSRSSCSTSASS